MEKLPLPCIDGRSDCVASSFDGDSESVVLLPNSGEVLVCSTSAWNEVVGSGILSKSIAENFVFSADAENLLATLDRMGIDLG